MPVFNNIMAGASAQVSADLGETIDQSVRMLLDGNYLESTLQATPSSSTMTVSFWYKSIATKDTNLFRYLYSTGNHAVLNQGDGLSMYNTTGSATNIRGSISTFTDPSAWYHFVARYSGGSYTLWINGVQWSSTSFTFSPSTNFRIGAWAASGGSNSGNRNVMYADFHYLDGTAKDEEDFGRYNDDGVWVPIATDFTAAEYGAAGFHLTFDSSQSNAGIGEDSAPIGTGHAARNDFTATGIETAAVGFYSGSESGSGSTYQSDSSNRTSTLVNAGSAFDGATAGGTQVSESAGGYWYLTKTINNVSGLRILMTGQTSEIADTRVNGSTVTTSVSGSYIVVSSPPSTVNEVAIRRNTANTQVFQVEVDTGSGFVALLDNFDNDVDYNDTPTSNYATLNPLNTKVNGTTSISNGNLRITATANNAYIDAQSTQPASEFDCYCEAKVTAQDLNGIGVGDRDAAIASGAGAYVTYRENGAIVRYPGNTNLGTEDTYDTGDVLGMTVTSTQVAFYKNGTLQGTYTHNLTGDFYAIGMAYNTGATSTMDFNFGQMPFQYTVPTGFKALQTNNQPEPTIKNAKDHFDIALYTGNTSSPPTVTGLNFQPDLMWIKIRSSGSNHSLYDSIRGATAHISPSDVSDEETDGSITPTSDGFTVGTENSIIGSTNANNHTYVAWCWKAGGTAVSNSDGSITSSVSANDTAGFSIVSWTGTGANATVGHGLSKAPTFVIVKNRDQGTNWVVGTTALDDFDTGFYLNTSAAKETSGSVFFNGTPPTTSVLHVGSSANTNADTKKMIAYCWAPVEGYSQFGEFDGNASSNGPFVYTGFKPAFILFKRNESAAWRIYDTARNPNNMATQILWPHTVDDEDTEPYGTGGGIDFLSNGFKVRDSGTTINNSGTPILYWAFAENPFGGANQPPVTAHS